MGVIIHGLRHTRLYRIWLQMKNRCFNINSERYADYGGRRITVCDEWRNDFTTFYNWAMSNGYSDDLTIDRINNNGNYEPSNCRWATVLDQNRNSRSCDFITYRGETHCLKEWCEILNLPYGTMCSRKRYGWSIDKMFERPIRNHKEYKNRAEKLFLKGC